jgi:hypothetical protein
MSCPVFAGRESMAAAASSVMSSAFSRSEKTDDITFFNFGAFP